MLDNPHEEIRAMQRYLGHLKARRGNLRAALADARRDARHFAYGPVAYIYSGECNRALAIAEDMATVSRPPGGNH